MNIIVIISDTFRYDNLFDRAAAMPVRTPHLDRFSERCVSLSRLHTGSFPTIPHRTDFTTGRVGWPWYPWQDRRLSSPNHLPQILGQAGYVSQLLGDCPHLVRAAFFEGFSGAHTLPGQEGNTYFLGMNYPIERAMADDKTRNNDKSFQGRNLIDLHKWTNRRWYREIDRFPPRTAELAVEWLEENDQHSPFFLWVDFFDPHEPWDPPEYMVRRYDPDYGGPPMLHPNYGKASDYTETELRNLRAHYCAEAELVDRWVGRILTKIDDLDLWRNSVVVFMSDHGICLGEHNRTGKSNISKNDDRFWPLYPEIVHVPFLVSAPGLEKGRTVDALLRPADIAPTLLDLAGVRAEPPEPMHGRSFAPLLRGKSSDPLHECVVSAGYTRLQDGALPDNCVTPVVYTERWAYAPVDSYGGRQLFDLSVDPLAETNVIDDHPDEADDLHDALIQELQQLEAPHEAVEVWQRKRCLDGRNSERR